MKKNQIKWGILGCGRVVEEKSGPAFNRVPNSSLYAVMRRNRELAKMAAEKLGAMKWYDNVDDLINDKNIDAIYIATPPGLHSEHAIACSRAQKPTYIEKPFARSYQEALNIVNAFEETNTPLFVAHYRRALPRFIELKKILESGEIGKVQEIDFRLTRKYLKSETDGAPSWLYFPEKSGGGKFFDIAPHSIDLLIYLFGDFEKVQGAAVNLNHDYPVEDLVVMSFKTTTGILGTANFNLLSNEKGDAVKVYGTEGYIYFNVHGDAPIKIVGKSGTKILDIKNPTCIEEPMIEAVVNEIIGIGSCPCPGKDALSTYKVMDLVLWDFYNGRDDQFWERPETWNKGR